MQFDNFEIRLARESDATDFFKLIDQNRERLEAFFAGTVAKTPNYEATKIYVSEIVEKQHKQDYFAFLVIDNHARKIAALVDVKNIDWNLPKAELGCFIDANYANQKISGKALKLVIGHLFETYPFEKLFLRTHETNFAAIALAKKCGFEKEGLLRNDYRTTAGDLVNLLYFGVLRP